MDSQGAINKEIVPVNMIGTSTDQYGHGTGFVIDVAVDFGAAGTIVVIGGDDAMAGREFVKITITDDIATFGGIAAIVDGALVVHFLADVLNAAFFNEMVVSMEENGHAGSVGDVTLGDTVANAFHPNGGAIGFLNPVEAGDTAVLHYVVPTFKRPSNASAKADSACTDLIDHTIHDMVVFTGIAVEKWIVVGFPKKVSGLPLSGICLRSEVGAWRCRWYASANADAHIAEITDRTPKERDVFRAFQVDTHPAAISKREPFEPHVRAV